MLQITNDLSALYARRSTENFLSSSSSKKEKIRKTSSKNCIKTVRFHDANKPHEETASKKDTHLDGDANESALRPEIQDHSRLSVDEVEKSTDCRSIICDICDRQLKNLDYLKTHVLSFHASNRPTFLCDLCEREFRAKAFFNDHFRTHSRSHSYECPNCRRAFKWENNIRSHLRKYCRARRQAVNDQLFVDDSKSHNDCFSQNLACDDCQKLYAGRQQLISHMRLRHAKLEKYVCSPCDKLFTSLPSFKQHQNQIHEKERGAVCDCCNLKYTAVGHLMAHLSSSSNCQTKKTTVKQECHICEKTFKSRALLREHVHRVHKRLQLSCDFCNSKFTSRPSLAAHVNFHEPNRPFPCSKCRWSFQYRIGLQTHNYHVHGTATAKSGRRKQPVKRDLIPVERWPNGQKRIIADISCDICQKKYDQKSNLTTHILGRHPLGEYFTCQSCQKIFTNKVSFKRHRMKKHSQKQNTGIICDNCDRKYADGTHFRMHAFQRCASHLENNAIEKLQPQKCHLCDLIFRNRHKLQWHLRSHQENKGRTFECDRCQWVSHTRAHLALHVSSKHEEKRRFPCTKCPSSFHMSCSLREHERHVHDRTAGKKCLQCGKILRSSGALKSHQLVHLDKTKRDFECKVCGERYFAEKRLRAHERRMHNGGKRFECPECDKTFYRVNEMKMHQYVHVNFEKRIVCQHCQRRRFANPLELKKHLRLCVKFL